MHQKLLVTIGLCTLAVASLGCTAQKQITLEYQNDHTWEFVIDDTIAQDMMTFVPESVLHEVAAATPTAIRTNKTQTGTILTPEHCEEYSPRTFCFHQDKQIFELRPLFSMGVDGDYAFFQNGKELFRHQMFYSSDGPILAFQLIDGSPLLTFMTGTNPYWTETYYKGSFIGEANGIKDVSNVFFYNGKLGFVTRGEGGAYLWYDGQKRSRAFDAIIGYGCCVSPRMFSVDRETGRVEFLARRGEKYYVGVVQL